MYFRQTQPFRFLGYWSWCCMKLEHVRRRMCPLHALFWHVVVYSGANETKWKDKGIPESSCRKLLIVFYIIWAYSTGYRWYSPFRSEWSSHRSSPAARWRRAGGKHPRGLLWREGRASQKFRAFQSWLPEMWTSKQRCRPCHASRLNGMPCLFHSCRVRCCHKM